MRFGNKAYSKAEDEMAEEILRSSETMEASEWLKLYPNGQFSSHTLDPDEPRGTRLAPIVERLMKAGAERVVVHHGDRKFFVGLLVRLPVAAKARKALFVVERELSEICNQQIQSDHGQKFLYYRE